MLCFDAYDRKSVLNLNELGQMNGSASGAAGGEDEEFPAPHELGEELKFTGRYERTAEDLIIGHRVQLHPGSMI